MLSASTTDFPAASAPAPRARSRGLDTARWHVPAKRFYIGLAIVALTIGALSLLIPSTPSYDPWTWIVWGREIVHLKLATAMMLIALERHLDGSPRQAFAVGFFVALDRPEIWLFWGPYGLWLFWKDPGMRVVVAASAVLVLLLWFVPVKLGCG